MKKSVIVTGITLALILAITACAPKTGGSGGVATGKLIKSAPVGNLTATLSNSTGQLKQGDQEVTLSFTDASGKPVDVGAVSLNFYMPKMGSMTAMNDAVTFTTTSTPGVYRGKVNLGHGGEWQAQLAYEGAAGTGKTTFSVSVQ